MLSEKYIKTSSNGSHTRKQLYEFAKNSEVKKETKLDCYRTSFLRNMLVQVMVHIDTRKQLCVCKKFFLSKSSKNISLKK